VLSEIRPDRPVLIAGPTASGKSGLALAIAERQGGVIINADALQVFAAWPILTAQPSAEERARAPHRLYGHLPYDASYSAGDWLREVAPLLAGPERPIVVGGTGLYFKALTEGLAPIPPIPPSLRAEADAYLAKAGLAALARDLDAQTRAQLDLANPARVQRAWEVQRATGRGLAAWQAATPPPLLPLDRAEAVLIEAPKDWLAPRIAERFEAMLAGGLLEEAAAEARRWNAKRQSARAIGAAALIAQQAGALPLAAARAALLTATEQYAKRQRTWFRGRMRGWRKVPGAALFSDS